MIHPSSETRKTTNNMKTYLIVVVNIALVTCNQTSSNLCLTPDCIRATSNILNNMDASVNPCDDFYQFACGNFTKYAIIPDGEEEVSSFQLTEDWLTQKLKVMLEENLTVEEPRPFGILKRVYKSCMNTTAIELDGLTTIKSILQKLGGWPVLEGRKWNEKKFDWKRFVCKLRNLGYSVNFLITLEIKEDLTNFSLNRLYIGPADVSSSYLNEMVNIANVLGAEKSEAESELGRTLQFERHLNEIAKQFEKRTYLAMSVSELQQKVPYIPWLEYLNSVLNITIKPSQAIVLTAPPDYFFKLATLLIIAPKRLQANYLMWKVVESSTPYITTKLGQHDNSTLRWTKCVDFIAESLPTAISAFYVRRYFHEDAKQATMEMASNIRNEFANMVKNIDWMDEVTRQNALEKIAAMSSYIGYPDEFLSDDKLEDFHKGLRVEFDNFLKVKLSLTLFHYESGFKRLVIPTNVTDWIENGKLDFNAYYYQRLNRISLPAAMFQGVFFSDHRPWYMNYGAIGFIIAHEIVHGFDNNGRKRDKFGQLRDWWAPSTKATFITKTQCIIDEYRNNFVPELGLYLNGIKTQGEDIADNGGIKIAYLAYNEWVRRNGKEPLLPGLNYTDMQLFWISAANVWCDKRNMSTLKEDMQTDSHSPAKFRINVALSNTDYFAKDFNCDIGSKMNPVKKCVVWKIF